MADPDQKPQNPYILQILTVIYTGLSFIVVPKYNIEQK